MRNTLITLLLLGLLGGCTIHKIDVQQGNVITRETVTQLKPGMTGEQVRFVLGSPMLTDPFHTQRWDYLYYFRHGVSGETTDYRLVLTFGNDGKLSKIEEFGTIPDDYEPPITRK